MKITIQILYIYIYIFNSNFNYYIFPKYVWDLIVSFDNIVFLGTNTISVPELYCSLSDLYSYKLYKKPSSSKSKRATVEQIKHGEQNGDQYHFQRHHQTIT